MNRETMTGFPPLNDTALSVFFRIPPEVNSGLELVYEQANGALYNAPAAPLESGSIVSYLDTAAHHLLAAEVGSKLRGRYILPLGVTQQSFDASPLLDSGLLYGTIYSPTDATSSQELIEYNFQVPAASGYTASEMSLDVTPKWVSAIKQQLQALMTSDDIDVKPTSYAFSRVRASIMFVYHSMAADKARRESPPAPVIGTDESGGVMVSWTSGGKYVAAKFGAGPELRSFVYFEQGVTHSAVDLSQQNLLAKVRWLAGR
jgi:hypothetical protein